MIHAFALRERLTAVDLAPVCPPERHPQMPLTDADPFHARERHNQSYQGRAAAIRALHPPVTTTGRKWCNTCSEALCPCPTIRALDGDPTTLNGTTNQEGNRP